MTQDPNGEAGERRRRLLEASALTIGISGGLFGALFAIALLFLPTDGSIENLLVVVACLAISAAYYMGVGAWEDVRRFTIFSALCAVTILALCLLSIAAREGGSPSSAAAAESKGSNPAPEKQIGSPEASPASTPRSKSSAPASEKTSPGPSPAGKAVYLTDLSPNSSDLQQGSWRIGSKNYRHSLGCNDSTKLRPTAVYRLDGKYRHLTGTVVLDEDAIPEESASVRIKLDGGDVQEFTTSAYHPAPVDVDVGQAQTVSIEFDMDTDWGTQLVFGEVRLTP